MDPLEAHWFSKLEGADDDIHESDFMNQYWETKKSMNNNGFHIPHSSANYQTENIQELCPSQKLFETSTKKMVVSSSSVPSTTLSNINNNIISFQDSDSNLLKNSSTHGQMHKYCTVKIEPPLSLSSDVGKIMNFSAQEVVSAPSLFVFGGSDQPTYKRAASNIRTPLQAQDHVLAERKRRERLSERFVALSTMIPGLKKLDKASVLGGAIRYLKHMEERIKFLEEENERNQKESSPNFNISKRTRVLVLASSSSDHVHETSSSSDEYSSSGITVADDVVVPPSPEIEVRISDTNVLIRVYCEKRNGIIKEILGEIEKLHLGIISSSVIPFGNTTLNITVIAQMDSEGMMRAQEIAKIVRMAIQKIM